MVGYVTATTLRDIFYIVKKQRNTQIGKQYVSDLLLTLEVCAVNQDIVKTALALNLDDFEDAVQLACAMNENLEAIVTRDLQGFVNSPIPILTAGEVLANLF
ncbi:MAG: type II toxin-antitoxin system VapC family toxin [Planktothrix sp.]|uniref:type II toxin-antitoxin system VapC family toxin n=1 Tax=Planktothrix sp. TaxID=3088171 RepID=UPI0038D4EC4A